MKKIFLMLILITTLCMVGCFQNKESNDERLRIIKIQSKVLNKVMTSQVYLPMGYDNTKKFPVLYFLPSNGGSSYTVIDKFGITDSIDRLVKNNQIIPMIIVALGIDNSFGINSNKETKRFKTKSEKSFDEGMYEDYIITEAIPYIDEHFNTNTSKEGRYIGGYSMGGFASLHIAFRHPNLFNKVGGHSPSLFIKDFPDHSVSDWLYPNEYIRSNRDPIMIAQSTDLTDLSIYLDTDVDGVNVDGCKELFKILSKKGIKVKFELFPGTHSFGYCYNNMDKYLLFYGSE